MLPSQASYRLACTSVAAVELTALELLQRGKAFFKKGEFDASADTFSRAVEKKCVAWLLRAAGSLIKPAAAQATHCVWRKLLGFLSACSQNGRGWRRRIQSCTGGLLPLVWGRAAEQGRADRRFVCLHPSA